MNRSPADPSLMQHRPGTVLLAEDDVDTRTWARLYLEVEGYKVLEAPDGVIANELALEYQPDLVLMDVEMPRRCGLEACRAMREHPRTRYLPVILVSGHSMAGDRIAALNAGADDYVVKPFDPKELIARIDHLILRLRQMRALNPLSGLPGNVEIEADIEHRIAEQSPFALAYIDIDNFKAFNDYYGYARGDQAIQTLASLIRDVARKIGGADAFAGHIGGDDFVAVMSPPLAHPFGATLVKSWDAIGAALYDAEDRERGYIALPNRLKVLENFKIAALSIGIASSDVRRLTTHLEAAEIASELKAAAKRVPGSCVRIDRRQSADLETLAL